MAYFVLPHKITNISTTVYRDQLTSQSLEWLIKSTSLAWLCMSFTLILLIQYLHLFIRVIQYYFYIYIYIYRVFYAGSVIYVSNIFPYIYIYIYRVFYVGSIAVCFSGMWIVIVRLRPICCRFSKERVWRRRALACLLYCWQVATGSNQ